MSKLTNQRRRGRSHRLVDGGKVVVAEAPLVDVVGVDGGEVIAAEAPLVDVVGVDGGEVVAAEAK